ncbi:type IV pilus biogenesis/stability protein PilW [Pseudoalteromonas sp. T1lg65]|uniref:type IV pilus biogenesis/stability protein PilW n=1 Tax=Pseudoalteromonas sp. T1lg65 TaxID=2077101 RepID=UPI003F78DF43
MALLLSGCVTENSYRSDGRPVAEQQINNTKAAKTRIALALQYLSSGNTTSAKFNFERALQLAPELAEAHYSLAYYYEQVGEQQRADQAYQAALKAEPGNPDTLNNYGTYLCRIGQYDKASEYFLEAIAVPSYLRVAQSYENLALCAIKQNQFSLAQDYLISAIQHNGQRRSAQLTLAGLYYAKSDFLAALEVLANFSARGFVSARSLMLEHLVHLQMGHIQKSQDLATTLIQTYPDSPQAALILKDELSSSEFEQLRNRVREAQLSQLIDTTPNYIVANPKIKIKRKKATDSNRFTDRSPSVDTIGIATSVQIAKPQTNTQKRSPKPSGEVEFYEPEAQDIIFNTEQSPAYTVVKQEREQGDNTSPLLNTNIAKPEVPFHRVIAGENLFSISVKYNVKIVELMRYNEVKESTRLHVGQKIYLKEPNIMHEISAGDTLMTIADRYGVLIDQLMRWNKLTPDVALKPGHGLLIVDPNNYML